MKVDPTESAFGMRGVSVRAYFAAAALNGYLAMHSDTNVKAPSPEIAAEAACRYADALCAELNKEQP